MGKQNLKFITRFISSYIEEENIEGYIKIFHLSTAFKRSSKDGFYSSIYSKKFTQRKYLSANFYGFITSQNGKLKSQLKRLFRRDELFLK